MQKETRQRVALNVVVIVTACFALGFHSEHRGNGCGSTYQVCDTKDTILLEPGEVTVEPGTKVHFSYTLNGKKYPPDDVHWTLEGAGAGDLANSSDGVDFTASQNEGDYELAADAKSITVDGKKEEALGCGARAKIHVRRPVSSDGGSDGGTGVDGGSDGGVVVNHRYGETIVPNEVGSASWGRPTQAGDKVWVGGTKTNGHVTGVNAADGTVATTQEFHGSTISIRAILPASDGVVLLGGHDDSSSVFHGWIAKLDGSNQLVWQQQSVASELFTSGAVDASGNIFVVGQNGLYEFSSTGSFTTSKSLSGASAVAIAAVSDGLIVAGAASGHPTIVKLDSSLAVAWAKTLTGTLADGGSGSDALSRVAVASDGLYLAGTTNSSGAGSSDVWVVKLDPTGGLLWQKTYGTSGYDVALALSLTSGGKVLVGGYTGSTALGLRLDSAGTVEVARSLAHSGSNDELDGLFEQSNGDIVVVGGAPSTDPFIVRMDADLHNADCVSADYQGADISASIGAAASTGTLSDTTVTVNSLTATFAASTATQTDITAQTTTTALCQ